MTWLLSNPADPAVRALADRHYSRQTPGSVRFVQSGKCIVFKVPGGRKEWVATVRNGEVKKAEQMEVAAAGWVTHWPIAAYVRHAWAGAWVNQFYRNESAYKSSDLIREAVEMTVAAWGPPPPLGMVTMIDPAVVRPTMVHGTPVVGWTYLQAGFERVGETKGGKAVFQQLF